MTEVFHRLSYINDQSTEMEMDMEVLLECLQCQKNDFPAMQRTLLSLASVFKSNEESREYFRQKGGLQYVHKLLFADLPTSVVQAAMFCLACAVESDVFCQNALTKPETFSFLHKIFSEEKSSQKYLHAAVFFFINLVAGNSVAQRLAKEKALVADLLIIFRRCAEKCQSSKRKCEEDLDLWSSIVIALSMCVNNPQNETNQRLCCTILPLCIQVVAEDRWRQLSATLLSFAGLTVAGNGYNQSRLKKCGVLDTLLKMFHQCEKKIQEDLSEMHAAVDIVSVINACITDNEENACCFISQGGVAVVMKLLNQPLQLTTHSLLQLVLALGHAGEYADNKTTPLTLKDQNILMHLLTESEDEEVMRAIKYVLRIWQKHAVDIEGQDHEDTDKETVITTQQIKKLLCSLGTDHTIEQNVLDRPVKELIDSASVIHGPHSQMEPSCLQPQLPSKTFSQQPLPPPQLPTSACPQLLLQQGTNDKLSVCDSLKHSTKSIHQSLAGHHQQDQLRFDPPFTSGMVQGKAFTGCLQSSAHTGYSLTTQAQHLNPVIGLHCMSQCEPSQPSTILTPAEPQFLQPPQQLQPSQEVYSSAAAWGSAAANKNLEQPHPQYKQQQSSSQVPASKEFHLSHSVTQSGLSEPQLARAPEMLLQSKSVCTQTVLETCPVQTSPTQCNQVPVCQLSSHPHVQQQLESSSLPQLTQTRLPEISQMMQPQFLPQDNGPLQPNNPILTPDCCLTNTPVASLEAEKSQERMAFHFFQKFLSSFGVSFGKNVTSVTSDRTEGTAVYSNEDADRVNEIGDSCSKHHLNSSLHYDAPFPSHENIPPVNISVEQRNGTLHDSHQNLSVSLDSVREHQHLLPNPFMGGLHEREQTCWEDGQSQIGSNVDERLHPEQNTAGYSHPGQKQSVLSGHLTCVNHSKTSLRNNGNSLLDNTNSVTDGQDTMVCSSCHKERPKTYSCMNSEGSALVGSMMEYHPVVEKSSNLNPPRIQEFTPCSCQDCNFRSVKCTQAASHTQQSSALETGPFATKSCDSSTKIQHIEAEPKSSNPERLRNLFQAKSYDSGNGPECTYLPNISKHSEHNGDFRLPLPKQSARGSSKSTQQTKPKGMDLTENTSSRIVRSPVWSLTPIVRKGLRRAPSRTSTPQICQFRTITSIGMLSDTLSLRGDVHRGGFTSQKANCNIAAKRMQSGRPRQNSSQLNQSWNSFHHNVTLKIPSSPAASEFDCSLLKAAISSPSGNQKVLPKTQRGNEADQHSQYSNSWSGSCAMSRSDSLELLLRGRNGKEKLCDEEDENCSNLLEASNSCSGSLPESSSCISEVYGVLDDCSIDLTEKIKDKSENLCPGCHTWEPLNSRNFNIIIETSAITCSAHRKIRQIERDFIMSHASNQMQKLSFQQWKEKMKGNGSDGNNGRTKKAKHGQSFSIFDFSSSGSDKERVSPPHNGFTSVSTTRPLSGDKARRHRVPYTDEEVRHLIRGVQQLGTCWQQILVTFPFHLSRTAVDLKDKYKQMQKQATARKKTDRNSNIPLSMCEERRLRRGVARLGHKWRAILQYGQFAYGRTAEELRDRWRVLSKQAGENF